MVRLFAILLLAASLYGAVGDTITIAPGTPALGVVGIGWQPNVPMAESLQAYLAFDSTGVDSIGTLTMTDSSAQTWKQGMTGFRVADSLNGTSNYWLQKGIDLNNTSGMVCLWANYSTLLVDARNILSTNDTVTAQFIYISASFSQDSTLTANWSYGGGAKAIATAKSILRPNQWVHIAFACSSNAKMLIFLNGKKIPYTGTGAADRAWFGHVANMHTLTIGARKVGTGNPGISHQVKGFYDQFLLYKNYNAMMDAAQIPKRLYEQGLTLDIQGDKSPTIPTTSDTIKVGY